MPLEPAKGPLGACSEAHLGETPWNVANSSQSEPPPPSHPPPKRLLRRPANRTARPKMEDTHPPLYKNLEHASIKCVSTGNDCLRHCFGMFAMKDTSMG